ncbi:MAG: hypothetical protein CMJ78_14810 [Planctomycetaceae bacterium]|nr:hypothetical protein [Planctomycetaceae bacterium]
MAEFDITNVSRAQPMFFPEAAFTVECNKPQHHTNCVERWSVTSTPKFVSAANFSSMPESAALRALANSVEAIDRSHHIQ